MAAPIVARQLQGDKYTSEWTLEQWRAMLDKLRVAYTPLTVEKLALLGVESTVKLQGTLLDPKGDKG